MATTDTELQRAERLARHTRLDLTEALQLVVLNRAAGLTDRELLVTVLRAQRVAAASPTGDRAFDVAYQAIANGRPLPANEETAG